MSIIKTVKVIILPVFLLIFLYKTVQLAQPMPSLAPMAPGWQTEIIDTPGCASSTTLALDNGGYPHVLYTTSISNALKYAYKDTNGWQIETITTSVQSPEYTSLDLDGNNMPHVSFNTGTNVIYAYRGLDEWHFQMVAANGRAPDIVVDATERPHVSYTVADWLGRRTLYHAYQYTTTWQTEAISGTIDANERSLITVDSSDQPHIIYSINGYLWYTYYDGLGWQFQSLWPGLGTSFVLDANDLPRFTYLLSHSGTDVDLKFAYLEAANWITQTVDNEGFNGINTLALDQMGKPHIGFIDGSYLNEAIKYAAPTADGWQIEIVASGGQLDEYTGNSMALDGADRPHFSYVHADESGCFFSEVVYAYPQPPLSISKRAPAAVLPGSHITYTLAVTNTGVVTLSNLIVTDTIPAGAFYVQGGVQVGDGVSWTLPSLLPGDIFTAQFAVTATSTITNYDYGASAEGGYQASGLVPVVTVIKTAIAGLSAASSGSTPLGQPTTFTATITAGDGVTFTWDFDDGKVAYGAVVPHTYTAAGVYTAVVTATNPLSTVAATTTVTVTKMPPGFTVYLPVMIKPTE